MDPELKKLFDDLNKTFATFRQLNDERWEKLKKGEGVDALLNMAVDRANAAVTEVTAQIKDAQEKIRAVETVQARQFTHMDSGTTDIEARHARTFLSLLRAEPIENLSDGDLKTYRDYKKAQNQYFRKGAQALSMPDVRNALSTGTAPGGGIWVTPDTSGRIVSLVYQTSPMRSLAAQQTLGTDALEGFNDLDEASSGWVGETDTRAETNTPNAYGKWSIPMQEQYANPKVSQKMLDDTQFDVEGWLSTKVSQKMARTENTGYVAGNGVLKPRGFSSYVPGANKPTKAVWTGVIERIKTGVNGAFAAAANGPADVFLDTIAALKVEYRQGAAFTMNSLTLSAARKLKNTVGDYLFMPLFFNGVATPPQGTATLGVGSDAVGSKIGSAGTIFGYNVYELQDLPDYNVGTPFAAYFGNWAEAYQIIDHAVGIRVLRDPYTGKPYVSFYTTKRTGGDVINFEALKAIQFSA